MQVVGEYVDRFGFRAVTQLAEQVGFQVGVELDLPGPAHHFAQPLVGRTVLVLQAETLGDHHFAGVQGARQLFADFQRSSQHAFVTAPENRQGAVRRHALEHFVVLEVIAKLRPFLFLAGHQASTEHRFLLEEAAQLVEQAGVFGEALHEDVLGAFEGGLDVRHAFFGVDKTCGFGFRAQLRVMQQTIGQLAQAGFQGDLALGAALLFIRQVKVFKARLGVGQFDLAGKLRRQFALLFNAGKDTGAAVVQLAQVAQALFQMTQLGVVQAAGHFFTVTGDKRHRRAFIQQGHGRFDLLWADTEFLGDAAVDAVHKTT
ncbi:hypothetical protein D3C80_560990 [compost metagenome]